MRRAWKLDERELAIRRFTRDARKETIELRQVLGERLATPKHGCRRPQSELLALDRQSWRLEGLVVDRQIGQTHQLFPVVLRPFGRLHELTREKIIDRGIAAGQRVPP